MKTRRAAQEFLPLTPTEEEILKIMSAYRYMTAVDVAHCLFSPKSLTYVRGILTRLAGGDDGRERQYLYRFPWPSGKAGNPERIFTLGSAGREVVQSLGIPIEWYYRPSKTGRLSGSYLSHQLLLTRFVICAGRFASQNLDYSLADVRLSYEIERGHSSGTGEAVVPDAWLHFAREDNRKFPVLVEIDRGTEYQERFKNHVRGRIEFIRSGEYARVFATPAVLIAYATSSNVSEHAETRRKTMCTWTMEVLGELELESWAGIFRFTSALVYRTLLEEGEALFTKPVWYRPDEPSKAVTLLG
jgi:hypothetical protein